MDITNIENESLRDSEITKDADNKNSVPKLRYVLKNSPEIGWFHVAPLALGQASALCK